MPRSRLACLVLAAAGCGSATIPAAETPPAKAPAAKEAAVVRASVVPRGGGKIELDPEAVVTRTLYDATQ